MNNPFTTRLFALKADLANLKIIFRSQALGRPWKDVQNELVTGSTLPEMTEEPYTADRQELIDRVSFDLPEPVKQALRLYAESGMLSDLEKALEEAEMDVVRSAKLIGYGPEVLVAYVYAVRNATRNVRLIMTGKVNEIDPETIKPRVRALY